MLAEKVFLKKRIKASLMLKTMPVVIVSSNIYYVHFDSLTIEDLACFCLSGKLFSLKAGYYPTFNCLSGIFDLLYCNLRQKNGGKIPQRPFLRRKNRNDYGN